QGRLRPYVVLGETGFLARGAILIVASLVVATAIAALSPLLWTTWRPRFLPWQLETYINGVHNLGTPQAWLFPIFPWTAFAFVGLAFGFILSSAFAKNLEVRFYAFAGVAVIVLLEFLKFVVSLQWQVLLVFDYLMTSPVLFMIR